jgi:hypothetical protein
VKTKLVIKVRETNGTNVASVEGHQKTKSCAWSATHAVRGLVESIWPGREFDLVPTGNGVSTGTYYFEARLRGGVE